MMCTLNSLCRWFSITIICLVFALGLKDVQAEPLECYSCTDQGGGECLPEKALNISCSPEYDACVEAIMAVRTSHSSHVVLKKGCGNGNITKLDQAIMYNGNTIYIELIHCKAANFCNTDMELKNYQLAPEGAAENITHDEPKENEQCYSCIEKPGEKCSPSSAPIMQCYDSYSHCFDGHITISLGNDTTLVPMKSCSTRYRCAVQYLTYGSTTLEIKGACCTKALCNNDLSNVIQLTDVPFLILLTDDNQEMTITAAKPQWLTPTDLTEENSMKGGMIKKRHRRMASANAVTSMSPTTQVSTDSVTNVACELCYWPCLLLILLVLS